MSERVVTVHRGRTVRLPVSLGYDVSDCAITSQIRKTASRESDLIVEWDVFYETDGKDGKVVLFLDHVTTGSIVERNGFMDLKRVSGGEVYPVFEDALEVIFKNVVTE